MGALGEVGSSVGQALTRLGHDVQPVSSRTVVSGASVLSVDSAIEAVRGNGFDFVVNAGGRGDKRAEARNPRPVTRLLGEACERSRVRGALISTVRVLEDAQDTVTGSAEPRCHSEYALANEHNEAEWIRAAPTQGHVLRLANFLCAPSQVDSPQVQLLPWSLVTEALLTGAIKVRSTSAVSREFVGPDDVARALIAVGRADAPPQVVSTIPGLRLTLEQLTNAVSDALEASGALRPTVSFGEETSTGPVLVGDWLSRNGWSALITPSEVSSIIAQWLSEHASIPK